MEAAAPQTANTDPPRLETRSRGGVLLRAGVFAFLAFTGLLIFTPLLSPLGYLLTAVFSTFAAGAVANVLSLRIYERAHLTEIGLFWNAISARHLLMGFAGGGGAAALILAPPLMFGIATLAPSTEPTPTWGTFAFVTFVLLFGVVAEEVLFRGYAFQVLVPVFGTWATVLPMGVLFGAAHSTNQNVTNLALFNTMAWGVLLGYAVLRSGDLWLAIGIHFGWNWTLPLFGVEVSGFKIKVTGYAYRWSVGELWSGGEYGPEAGILCSAVLLVMIAFLIKAPIRRQHLPLASPRQKEP
ncbi:MAG: CPBP family intramembrane metalloprotease [Acidimicrobiia bacterium]|nr:CPBP family intramembrane metalloprotease [Acidimicrobiia bacterium]